MFNRNTTIKSFRLPTSEERVLFDRLLSVPFPGRNSLAEMLSNVKVQTIDEEGSLKLHVVTDTVLVGVKAVPVEAEGVDDDGVGVHVLLHVVHGLPDELEIYKDDSSAIVKMPGAAELQVVVLPPAPWELQP